MASALVTILRMIGLGPSGTRYLQPLEEEVARTTVLSEVRFARTRAQQPGIHVRNLFYFMGWRWNPRGIRSIKIVQVAAGNSSRNSYFRSCRLTETFTPLGPSPGPMNCFAVKHSVSTFIKPFGSRLSVVGCTLRHACCKDWEPAVDALNEADACQ